MRLAGHERVGGGHQLADDDGVEAVDLAQFLLPADQLLDLAAALDVEVVDDVLGDDDEEGEVDRVDALAQDRPLAAALAAAVGALLAEERQGVLEVVAVHHAGQRLAGRRAARRRGRRRSRSCPAGW